MMVARKKTDVVQLSKIRMTESLRARLARDAKRNGITLNGEIVDRLEKSYANEAQSMRDSAIVDLLVDRDKSERWRPLLSLLAKNPELLDQKFSAEAAMKSFAKDASIASRKEPDEESEPGDDK
jgi:hypothetical protein